MVYKRVSLVVLVIPIANIIYALTNSECFGGFYDVGDGDMKKVKHLVQT